MQLINTLTKNPVPSKVLSMHAAVSGPCRGDVLASLAEGYKDLPVLSLGGLVGEPLGEQQTADLLDNLSKFTASAAVIVTEFSTDQKHYEMIVNIIRYARANGVGVLIGAETLDDIPEDILNNVALNLYAGADGSVVEQDNNLWSLVKS